MAAQYIGLAYGVYLLVFEEHNQPNAGREREKQP